jgi:hypothetical protein
MKSVVVDNTILRSVATCPTQAAVTYHLGWRPVAKGLELLAGEWVHAALEALALGETVDAAMEVFERGYKGLIEAATKAGRLVARLG